ncbi:MAG: NAD(P)H-dependent oxidoreductase [Pseudomonadota bacterium]
MKLLHIDSSIQGTTSASRTISTAVVDSLRAATPTLDIAYRDLAAAPLSHLQLDSFAQAQNMDILAEFQAADIVVIGTGLYNFTIPSQLKAWIDRILVAGQTFRYGDKGVEGLAGGKRIIVALARGGIYGAGSPMASFEHAESLLRSIFTFIGIHEPEFIIAEGIKLSEEAREQALDAAISKARAIAVNMPAD